MKKLATMLFAISLGLVVSAQTEKPDAWVISLNKKVIVSTNVEDEAANTKRVVRSSLTKKAASLEIHYTQGRVRTGWDRSVVFYDENDKELLTHKIKMNLKLNAEEMKKLAVAGSKIKIYTIAVPSDPKIAATVRVRRVHLCTFEL